jgi:hypothetical protein
MIHSHTTIFKEHELQEDTSLDIVSLYICSVGKCKMTSNCRALAQIS